MLVDFHGNKIAVLLDPSVCPEGVIVRLKVGPEGSSYLEHLGLTVPPDTQWEDRAEWCLNNLLPSEGLWLETEVHDLAYRRVAEVNIVAYSENWVLEVIHGIGVDDREIGGVIRTPLPFYQPYARPLTPLEARMNLGKVFENEAKEPGRPLWERISKGGLISEDPET